MTITEGLAEINLLKKKLNSKKQPIEQALVTYDGKDDPYEAKGGAKKFLETELQSCTDLRTRLMKIRAGIAEANIKNTATINGQTRSIYEWLTWKREVATELSQQYSVLRNNLQMKIDSFNRQPQVLRDEDNNVKLCKPIANIELTRLQDDHESIEDTLGKLDGVLSLKNATTTINI